MKKYVEQLIEICVYVLYKTNFKKINIIIKKVEISLDIYFLLILIA